MGQPAQTATGGELRWTLLYGFALWLIPFLFSILIYPLKQAGSPLFETLMPVVLALCAIVFTCLYFRAFPAHYLRDGVRLGLVWMGMSIALDLLLFTWGPMAMGFLDYLLDIGLTYLLFPILTVGSGWLLHMSSGQSTGGAGAMSLREPERAGLEMLTARLPPHAAVFTHKEDPLQRRW
jgi:hypothetical protein